MLFTDVTQQLMGLTIGCERLMKNLSNIGLAVCLLLASAVGVAGATKDSALAKAEQAHSAARERFQGHPSDPEAGWQLGLACFDWADLVSTNPRRAELAEEGIAACRETLAHAPKSAAAHYYLALNLGQLARTRKLSALKLISDMEAELKTTAELDARFDYAGPDRTLGLLYRDAPGWPTSVGSRSKARTHLRKAVELSPDYPDNRLSLLESYLKWGERSAVQSDLAATEESLERARKTLTGPRWESSWSDWDHQWEKIKRKAEETQPKGRSK